jgi:tricorn protease
MNAMKKIRQLVTICCLIAGMTFISNAANDSRLMRFPDINGDLVAFVYAGDIWTVGSKRR